VSWARGLRVPVSDLGVSDVLNLGLGSRPPGFEVVVAGLEADDTLVDRAFLLSRHQPESFEGSVAIGAGADHDTAAIAVQLGRVPASVQTVRIALIGDARLSADDLDEAWLRLLVDGRQTARWDFTGSELSGERAIIVADLYRRDGWRLAFHGTGYRAGLRAFLEHIDGGTRLPGAPEEQAAPAAPPAPPAPQGAPFAPPPGVAAPPPPPPAAPSPPPAPPHPAPQPAPAGSGWSAPPGPTGPAPIGPRRRPGTLRTGLSWRERIFSVPVARALTSGSGLGLAGAGAVAGGAGAAAAGIPIVLGAVGLGGAAWLGRAAVAIPGQRGEKIDPFTLREPWRHFVRDAMASHETFQQLVRRTPEGPLHDRLAEIGERLEEGLRECWRIASRGDNLREARLAIDDGAVRAELASLHGPHAAGDPASRARLAEALQSQVDAADRLDRVIDQTYNELRLLDARMDNAVARALEISVSATDQAAYGHLGAEVDGLVDDLEALRQGLEEIRGAQPG
jgi:stress response protein SCP2